MTLLIILGIIFVFIIYLIVDALKTGNINSFFDNWVKKTLWIWLPFYALKTLWKEVHKK